MSYNTVQQQEMEKQFPDDYRKRQIYIRIIEQVSADEAIELISVLNRMNRFKWMLDLRVRIR